MSKDRRQPKVLRVDLIVLPKAWRFVGANMCYTSYTVIPWMTIIFFACTVLHHLDNGSFMTIIPWFMVSLGV